MNKMIKASLWAKCALMALLSFALTACSDNDLPALAPTLPANGGSNLLSYTHLGNVPSCYDWSFRYSKGRLVRAEGVVRDPSASIDRSYSYVSTLGYGYQLVKVNNSNGDKVKLQLNALGYIQNMTVNRNIYNFFYDALGYMIGWNKIVFEESFGQAQQYKTSASIEYVNGNLSKVTYIETDNRPITLRFTPSAFPNTNGLIPAMVSKELGCLGFEHLYYAGLLGRSTQNLVKSVFYEFPDSEKNYQVDFEYSNKGGNIVLCNYHTPEGNVASISYNY